METERAHTRFEIGRLRSFGAAPATADADARRVAEALAGFTTGVGGNAIVSALPVGAC
jgi:hypothetical protein